MAIVLVPGHAAPHDTSPAIAPLSENALRLLHTIVEKTNEERRSRGIPPLYMQEGLVKASVAHARDMATHHYFGHHTPRAPQDVEDFEDYARAQDYEGQLAENLYHGEPQTTQILKLWMATQDHRSNILNADYHEVGVGFARGQETDDSYCVQFLGSRDDCYPMVINNEAYSTTDPQVHLYLYGKARIKQMRFSADGTTFTAWEPFSSTKDWALPAGEGKKTVYVELSDGEKTYKGSDSIQLVPSTKE